MWRYSMAAVIVAAAMLDVFWWVPAQQARRAERAHAEQAATEQVRARMPRCRAAEIREQKAAIADEIKALQAQMYRLDAELRALVPPPTHLAHD